MVLRFTKAELEDLTKKARKTHYSREGFCRAVLNGATVKEAPDADVGRLIMEMRRVGANVNLHNEPAYIGVRSFFYSCTVQNSSTESLS